MNDRTDPQRHRCLTKPMEWQRNLPDFLDVARRDPQVRERLVALRENTLALELRLRSDVQSLRAQAAATERAADDHLEAAQIMKSILDAIDEDQTP